MNEKRQAQLNARAEILKALAHPTRLCIVEELEKGERRVGDLTKLIGDDMSTVSKHLTILKNAGLVSDQKRGTTVFYRLRVPCVMNFMNCVEAVMTHRLNEQIALVTGN